MAWRILLLQFGMAVSALAVIFIKASTVHPVLLVAWRLAVAAAVLWPLFARDLARYRDRYGWSHLRRSLLPGLFLAGHFLTWTMGSRRTPAANATLLGNMVIVYMPFYLFGLLGERINRGELAGTFLAAAGMVVLGVSDAHISLQRLGGDAIIFLSSQLVCVYLVLARRNGDFPSIWLYVVPMYAMAALVSFVAALPWRLPWQVGSTENLLYLLGLGLGPTVIGHSVLNYSFKHMRGQLVSLLCLAEFVFATLLAWPIFGEVPRWPFYLAGGMLVCGAAVAILTSGRKAAPEPVEEAV